MTIDQEIAVRTVFVLANACFGDFRARERWEPVGDIGTHFLDHLWRDQARLRIGIDALAMTIEGDFEAARFDIRHTVKQIFLEEPSGQRGRSETVVARRHSKKKDFLARGENARAEKVRKTLGEPSSARENELRGLDRFAVRS